MRHAAYIMGVRHAEIVEWLIGESGSTRLKAELEWQFSRSVVLEAASMPYRVKGASCPVTFPARNAASTASPWESSASSAPGTGPCT